MKVLRGDVAADFCMVLLLHLKLSACRRPQDALFVFPGGAAVPLVNSNYPNPYAPRVLPQVLRCSGAITSYELVCICIIIILYNIRRILLLVCILAMHIMHTTSYNITPNLVLSY